MKPKLYWKRGAILLQTLVVSVLLLMIAVMVLKWVMARYIMANRVQASSRNTGTAQGYAAYNVNTWNIPPNASVSCPPCLNGKAVSFVQTSAGSGRFVTTVDDDY